jgi:hypothetical protein
LSLRAGNEIRTRDPQLGKRAVAHDRAQIQASGHLGSPNSAPSDALGSDRVDRDSAARTIQQPPAPRGTQALAAAVESLSAQLHVAVLAGDAATIRRLRGALDALLTPTVDASPVGASEVTDDDSAAEVGKRASRGRW